MPKIFETPMPADLQQNLFDIAHELGDSTYLPYPTMPQVNPKAVQTGFEWFTDTTKIAYADWIVRLHLVQGQIIPGANKLHCDYKDTITSNVANGTSVSAGTIIMPPRDETNEKIYGRINHHDIASLIALKNGEYVPLERLRNVAVQVGQTLDMGSILQPDDGKPALFEAGNYHASAMLPQDVLRAQINAQSVSLGSRTA